MSIANCIDSMINHYDITHPENTVESLVNLYKKVAAIKNEFWKEEKLKQIKEEFNAFKVEMESARNQDPNLKAQELKTKAFYDKDNANIERWSKKIPKTSHPKRRVIEVE